MEGLEAFGPATRAWFEGAFEAVTPVQRQGWPVVAEGAHALLSAPTGSGKTLAAFLWSLDRLSRLGAESAEGAGARTEPAPGVRVLYVSPLKALVHDVERNLRAPLAGIVRAAERAGEEARMPRVAVRTGDTPQRAREQQRRDPAEILVTTPESLYLMLTSRARETLTRVETVIVDEVHALAPSKRGAHLALSLERLTALAERDPQRLGLSATARPLEEVARFLGGDREVRVVDATEPPHVDLRIEVPVEDMARPDVEAVGEAASGANEGDGPGAHEDGGAGSSGEPPSGPVLAEVARRQLEEAQPHEPRSMWPAVTARLVQAVRAHRTTIVFVNSRGLCERLAQRINDMAHDAAVHEAAARGEPEPAHEELVRAHHGSVAHDERRDTEELLKEGRIRGIVATSSLELGIDMAAVDLVALVESPGSVARGLQRVGRAGHEVGAVSRGRLLPKHRGDLLESAVVVRRMSEGAIEPLRIPRNPLDVLAQQIVAACAMEPWTVGALEAAFRRAAPFRELTRELLTSVLDMLAGRYPSNEFADLKPRIVWDRDTDELRGRRGARSLAVTSGGTIPDRGLYTVQAGQDGPRVGELDEEMVHETKAGQVVALGATSWRVEEITRDRVIVSPAPGEPGKLPFWHGEGPGRPLELGRALGAFVREVDAASDSDAEARLQEHHAMDTRAARNLVRYVREQREAAGTLPTDRAVVVERFRDELGDVRVCILSPFGSRVHAPWALAIGQQLGARAGFEVQTTWSDDGIVLRFVDADELPGAADLLPDPDELEELVVEQLGGSALFAARFRENAARSLLLPRRAPNRRTPLWAQRLKAQQLLAVARQYPSFPVILETYRTCLRDVFDVPAASELLRAIRRREVRVREVDADEPSPFARSLVFTYIAAHIYEGDAPLAERKAHALALDRSLLRDLLGDEELRQLLDSSVLDEVEAELQHTASERNAKHADSLHDVLRRVGDLRPDEVAARCAEPPDPWLDELVADGRAVRLRIAGEERWIAGEDAGLYRDATGAMPPPGVPSAFLEPVHEPQRQLLRRWVRTHGPFEAGEPARRWDLPVSRVESVLAELEGEGLVLRGAFRPEGTGVEWCDPEVLRRLRRRSLARLRDEVAPVEASVLGRFLPGWHGVEPADAEPGRTDPSRRLREGLAQLEGLPVSFRDLEQLVLPARVPGYRSHLLDELGAMGEVVWVGHGPLGKRDGRVALYRRDRVGLLLDPPAPEGEDDALHAAIVAHLERRGACFFAELRSATAREGERPPGDDELLDALWDLVWQGRVTNDTFLPLRALTADKRTSRKAAATETPGLTGGRWSLVADLVPGEPRPTEQAHARALALLERHGVLGRRAMGIEAMPGGFGPIYQVLRTMEEAGKVRRGYFVEGLGGAQFAWPGAVDRLRAARATPDEPVVHALAAADPATPWGATLAWPEPRSGQGPRPKRAAGAAVVLVDGDPALYVERSGKGVTTFSPVEDHDRAVRAASALSAVARTHRGRILRIEAIDGEPARRSALADAFREAGFAAEHRGLTLEARAIV